MNPNSALSAWQLAVMAAVPVAALAVWLTAIFLAAREPHGHAQAAAASQADAAAPETRSAHVVPVPVPVKTSLRGPLTAGSPHSLAEPPGQLSRASDLGPGDQGPRLLAARHAACWAESNSA